MQIILARYPEANHTLHMLDDSEDTGWRQSANKYWAQKQRWSQGDIAWSFELILPVNVAQGCIWSRSNESWCVLWVGQEITGHTLIPWDHSRRVGGSRSAAARVDSEQVPEPQKEASLIDLEPSDDVIDQDDFVYWV